MLHAVMNDSGLDFVIFDTFEVVLITTINEGIPGYKLNQVANTGILQIFLSHHTKFDHGLGILN